MDLGRKLWVRTIVNMASEPIPYFWPMRNFVHHNPLHELESMPFVEAVKEGFRIFGGRGYLSREEYMELLKSGKINERHLRKEIRKFVEDKKEELPINLEDAIYHLMTNKDLFPYSNLYMLEDQKINEELIEYISERFKKYPEEVCSSIIRDIGHRYTIYDVIDLLKNTRIGETIDEITIKTVINFIDEGQSAIGMPNREKGLFKAWLDMIFKSWKYLIKGGNKIRELLEGIEEPEELIDEVMKSLKLPEDLWESYLTLELAKLKGIVGFIRWRSHNKNYYWQNKYPIDVVEYTAVRLAIGKAVMDNLEAEVSDYESLSSFLLGEKERAFLMYEYNSGNSVGELVEKIPENINRAEEFIDIYVDKKAKILAKNYLIFISKWLSKIGVRLEDLSRYEISKLIDIYEKILEEEGYIWLNALEESFIERTVRAISVESAGKKGKPFAQALFCIDVRSERFRRNLERVGDYETYGIAGFFGVPMAFVELSKGHEEYLCPVLIKPRNVVVEVPKDVKGQSRGYLHILKEVLHDLKENVLTPYITVEAIGFLFGFDFFGKTFLPLEYSKTRESIIKENIVSTDILLDKLSKEELESIVNTVYEIYIRKILRYELNLGEERITKSIIEEIINTALEGKNFCEKLSSVGIDSKRQEEFFEKLRKVYRIDRGYRELIMERLKNVGFSEEEKAGLVANALKAIGLTENFGQIVLVVGHGSKSDNNPYESALDCGACGGSAGLHNARVFCKMANDKRVRDILKERYGIVIPEETVFIPALHNTTTDEVTLHDMEHVPAKYSILIRQLKEDLEKARLLTSSERYEELNEHGRRNGYARLKDVEKNAYDWSQVRPEWGLSGNYAFIIGERYLTRKADFKGKVFLHSYNYRIDKKGFLLENILSGPLIVGEWINMEHYFSTVDNDIYGSGSKVYHNVVGRIGVMTGNLSDIKTGLPSQTVLRNGLPFHNPVRLIVLISAPFEFTLSVINRIYKVRELIKNGWINIIIFDPEKGVFYRYREGEWIEIELTEVEYEGAESL